MASLICNTSHCGVIRIQLYSFLLHIQCLFSSGHLFWTNLFIIQFFNIWFYVLIYIEHFFQFHSWLIQLAQFFFSYHIDQGNAISRPPAVAELQIPFAIARQAWHPGPVHTRGSIRWNWSADRFQRIDPLVCTIQRICFRGFLSPGMDFQRIKISWHAKKLKGLLN